MSDEKRIDPLAEATVQAAAGASTDPDSERSYAGTDIADGAGPDPDLAQGESD